tara:strand:- start:177 stop:386 length:210 start_codon:yes stop_codon:yes gene_type:complete
MSRQLLASAQNILRYVIIGNNGVVPIELIDDATVLSEHEKLEILEDLYHDEAVRHRHEQMQILLGKDYR